MKFVYCEECHDIVRLQRHERMCLCGKAAGRYVNDLDAEYWGTAVPLGLANSSFVRALRNQPESGMGEVFEAFVIPKKCPTMKKVASPYANTTP